MANQKMADMSQYSGLLGVVLLGLIILVIGFYLAPTLQVASNSTVTASGSTSLAGSLAPIVVGLFVVVLLAVAVGLIIKSLGSS